MSFRVVLASVVASLVSFSSVAHAIDLQVSCMTRDGLVLKSGFFAGGDGPIFLWQDGLTISYRSDDLVTIGAQPWSKSPLPSGKDFYNYSDADGTKVLVELDPNKKQVELGTYYTMDTGFLTLDITLESGRRVTRNHAPVKCYTDGRGL